MRRRVPQPGISPAARASERHGFWLGFGVALAGAALALGGALHVTAIETKDGGKARETQLIKACSSSGLQFPDQLAEPPPSKSEEEAERPIGQAAENPAPQTAVTSPEWKVRVDTTAAAPCPT